MSQFLPELVLNKLIASGYEGILNYLPEFKNFVIDDKYQISNLFNKGGQSLIWLGQDINECQLEVLIRMALLPYHRPAYVSLNDILNARKRIEFEYELLYTINLSILPSCYGLFHDNNPLIANEFGKEISNSEPYLVMEYIAGYSLDKYTRFIHSSKDEEKKQKIINLSLSIVRCLLKLNIDLKNNGILYVDISPRNIIVPEKFLDFSVRIVDAGSIIDLKNPFRFNIPYTREYILPEYYKAYKNGEKKLPTESSVLYSMGVTIWQLLTNDQPLPGVLPDSSKLDPLPYHKVLKFFLGELLHQGFSSFEGAYNFLLEFGDQMKN